MELLRITGQDGLLHRMQKLYIPAKALQGYIIAQLGGRVDPHTPCASFDEGVKLRSEHGGKGAMAQTCWQMHPGLCATLDGPILEPSLAFAESLISYVRRIGSASQRYLMFVRQDFGVIRKHVLVFMAGSTLISSGPRAILFAQKIVDLNVPRVRKTALRQRPCAGAEDWMPVYHQTLVSHHQATGGFLPDSTVRCEHLSRLSPRFKQAEPAWMTQFLLGVALGVL